MTKEQEALLQEAMLQMLQAEQKLWSLNRAYAKMPEGIIRNAFASRFTSLEYECKRLIKQ